MKLEVDKAALCANVKNLRLAMGAESCAAENDLTQNRVRADVDNTIAPAKFKKSETAINKGIKSLRRKCYSASNGKITGVV